MPKFVYAYTGIQMNIATIAYITLYFNIVCNRLVTHYTCMFDFFIYTCIIVEYCIHLLHPSLFTSTLVKLHVARIYSTVYLPPLKTGFSRLFKPMLHTTQCVVPTCKSVPSPFRMLLFSVMLFRILSNRQLPS